MKITVKLSGSELRTIIQKALIDKGIMNPTAVANNSDYSFMINVSQSGNSEHHVDWQRVHADRIVATINLDSFSTNLGNK